jgi:hypothetical protein
VINDTALGFIAAAVPLVILGFLFLRRLPWIFAFFVALLAVGLGYLQTTGTVREIGQKVREVVPAGVLPERKSAPAKETTAPAAPPAEAPAMAPATPAPEPAPAPAATPPPPAAAPTPAPANP